jgi:iron complex transport system substrate-binding protein
MRIVSLLPGATDVLVTLGLERHLVGVSHECDGPASLDELPAVTASLLDETLSSRAIDEAVRAQAAGGEALYRLDVDRLAELQPDFILTQKLCDVCAVAEDQVHAAASAIRSRPQVITLAPHDLASVLADIRRVAEILGHASRGDWAVGKLEARIEAVRARTVDWTHRPRVSLLEWLDPIFSTGHWGPELVALAGGEEGHAKAGDKSRTLAFADVVAWQPEVLVLACCGYTIAQTLADVPILEREPDWASLPCVENRRVYVADGAAYFNRPGPRLVDSLEILARAIDPTYDLPPRGSLDARAVRLNLSRRVV